MSDVNVQGMDDLLNSLKIFSDNFQNKVVKGAVRAGAAGIVKDAKRNVPKHLGALKKSIGLTQRKQRVKTLIGFAISPKKNLLVKEFIKAGRVQTWSVSKITGFKSSNFDNYGGYVEFGTSNQSAHPYLRPAYEHMGPESIRLAREYMSKRIDKEIERAKK